MIPLFHGVDLVMLAVVIFMMRYCICNEKTIWTKFCKNLHYW